VLLGLLGNSAAPLKRRRIAVLKHVARYYFHAMQHVRHVYEFDPLHTFDAIFSLKLELSRSASDH
jgi:hypothetical protein